MTQEERGGVDPFASWTFPMCGGKIPGTATIVFQKKHRRQRKEGLEKRLTPIVQRTRANRLKIS